MAKKPENPDQPEEDRVELASLFKRYYRKVVYYFLRVGIPEEEARDLAQETFLRAHRGRNTFRGEASESTWLFEIARNIFKNRVRDNQTLRKKRIEISLSEQTSGSGEAVIPSLAVGDYSPLPYNLTLEREGNESLKQALVGLSTQQRQCVELRLADLKYHEIAAIMGLSIETIKSHLHQARQRLKNAVHMPE